MRNFSLFMLPALMLHHISHANTPVGALHNDPNLCSYGYNPNCQPRYQLPPADFSTPPLLANASNHAIAFLVIPLRCISVGQFEQTIKLY